MIDELIIERWLKDNFEVQFIEGPTFTCYEIYDKEVFTKYHAVTAYVIKGLDTLKKILSSPGINKIFVYRDQMGHILFNSNLGKHIIIRMYIKIANQRYKLKDKKICQRTIL